MVLIDLLLLFANKFENFNSILETLGYVFLFGFIIFIIFYFKRLKDQITSWKEMDSFGKIIFIFLIGLLFLVPIILFSLFLFLIGMIFWEIIAPYTCGEMITYFGEIFFSMTFIYLVYILFKFKTKKLDSKLLVDLFSLWKPLKYIGWIDLLLLVLVLIVGIFAPCIYYG